ncbi:unnamed protein product [Polarella glacialis]|uniref:Uncharacterized protein n=1 Tax=Polarella glacialis TaxID=89957 RepID=A0A813I1H5_POLGL|nr:unnamed protein product [Polarella glacialis]
MLLPGSSVQPRPDVHLVPLRSSRSRRAASSGSSMMCQRLATTTKANNNNINNNNNNNYKNNNNNHINNKKKSGDARGQATAAISSLGKQRRWQEALATFRQLQKPDLATEQGGKSSRGIDCVAFNCIANALARGQQWQRALQLTQVLRSDGLRPDVVTANTALLALRAGGKGSGSSSWRTAWQSLRDMWEHPILIRK